jgi:hypothetical protein
MEMQKLISMCHRLRSEEDSLPRAEIESLNNLVGQLSQLMDRRREHSQSSIPNFPGETPEQIAETTDYNLQVPAQAFAVDELVEVQGLEGWFDATVLEIKENGDLNLCWADGSGTTIVHQGHARKKDLAAALSGAQASEIATFGYKDAEGHTEDSVMCAGNVLSSTYQQHHPEGMGCESFGCDDEADV